MLETTSVFRHGARLTPRVAASPRLLEQETLGPAVSVAFGFGKQRTCREDFAVVFNIVNGRRLIHFRSLACQKPPP
jgi:hypothetical protein